MRRVCRVLHPVCGRPILLHALEPAASSAPRAGVVVGSGEDEVRKALAGHPDVEIVRQADSAAPPTRRCRRASSWPSTTARCWS
jgi:bifunctional N-acetylglucosamine-1-phosphate-uridyltransferase/glucosamine-1-phosphate-acetyltransferase GlmU-like protein